MFLGKYKHKIVLVTPVAYLLRNGNIDLAKVKASTMEIGPINRIKNVAQYNYFNKVCNLLIKYKDEFIVRIENPRLNIYTDNVKLLESLAKIDENNVKFIVLPNNSNPTLEVGKVILKKINYDFKVYVASTKRNHTSFIEWSKNNSKIRMPRRCATDLSRDYSWGGSYFYVKDDKTLTMVKMFLGSDISKIEHVIKA
jgi:hypothetical protein